MERFGCNIYVVNKDYRALVGSHPQWQPTKGVRGMVGELNCS